jgi:hypothetical protein
LSDLTDAVLLRRLGSNNNGRLRQALFYIARVKHEIDASIDSPESVSVYSFVLAEMTTLLWLIGNRNRACQVAQDGKGTLDVFFADFVHTFCDLDAVCDEANINIAVDAANGAAGQPLLVVNLDVDDVDVASEDLGAPPAAHNDQQFVLCVQDSMINLGNRLVVVVGCHLLALLTGRELLVAWENHAAKEWNDMFHGPSLSYDEALSRYLDANGKPWPNVVDIMDNLEFWADYDQQTQLDDLVCANLTTRFTKPILAVRGNVNFVPLLMKNPHYAAYISETFPQNDLFGYLARQVIKPKANILKHIDTFYEQNMMGYRTVVGVHLRMGMDDGDWQWKKTQHHDGEIQKGVAMKYTNECLVKAIGELVVAAEDKKVVVFVAADDMATRNKVLASVNFGDMHLAFQEQGLEVKAVAFESKDAIARSTLKDIQLALVDLFLLSKCNLVVRGGIGALSFFSQFAASYGSRESVYFLECDGKLECRNVKKGSQPKMGTMPKHINANGLTCHPGEPQIKKHQEAHPTLGANNQLAHSKTLSGMLLRDRLLYPICEGPEI